MVRRREDIHFAGSIVCTTGSSAYSREMRIQQSMPAASIIWGIRRSSLAEVSLSRLEADSSRLSKAETPLPWRRQVGRMVGTLRYMGYPKRLLSEDEVIVSEFRPHWTRILKEGALLVLIVVLIILVQLQDWSGWISLGLIVAGLLVTAAGLTRWLTTLHVITNERVIYRAGLFSKTGKEIPHEVINDVAFNQRALERIFGTGDLLIESAGTHGQTRYQDIPDPEGVQSLIYREREKRMTQQNIAGMPSSAPTSSQSVAEQLDTISRLHDEGKLSGAEFETQKRKLLEGF
jgi:membrane protein YdbS with pleckstrin-like domain